ncbi:HigA family addiction module antitoxin [Actinomyces oris]|uniref:HigA family addiction module antitoxin n=1 Tax=Actinomyces oris TaxID=544580 RepID=UPI0023DD22BF|nr:HigA family addiction module antitoxin [Actinomyces oris]
MTSGGSASYGLALERRRLRSLTTTETNSKHAPVHPGEVLMEDFIEGFGITQNKLAVAIGVPPRRINEIVHGKRAVTADTALRLGKYFGVSAQFWLNLQTQYDLDVAADRLSKQIDAITPLRVA